MEQEEMLAFVRWVAEQTGTDEETVANQLQELSQSEEGQQLIQEMYNAYIQSTGGVQQGQLQTQASQAPVMARMGAKISHIKRIYGMCPEGYELKSFKIGGKVCKKCQKIAKKADGGDVKKEENSKAKDSFKKKTPSKKVTKAQNSVAGGVKPQRSYDKNGKPIYDPKEYTLTSDTLEAKLPNGEPFKRVVHTYSSDTNLPRFDQLIAKPQVERDTVYMSGPDFMAKNASKKGNYLANITSKYTSNELNKDADGVWWTLTNAWNEAYKKVTNK